MKGADQIHIDHRLEGADVEHLQFQGGENAAVGDEHFDSAGLIEGSVDGVKVFDVTPKAETSTLVVRRMEPRASYSFWGLRAKMETRAPSAAARRGRARPMLLKSPEMKTWRPLMGMETGRMRRKKKSRENGKRRREEEEEEEEDKGPH